MAVLTAQEKDLLNHLADSQPALNKPGIPLGSSQIQLGEAIATAQSHISVKVVYDFAVNGGTTGAKVLGRVPAGCYVVGIMSDEATAVVGCTSADVLIDGVAALSNYDFTASSGIVNHTSVPVKAVAGVVALNLDVAASAGKVALVLHCIVV